MKKELATDYDFTAGVLAVNEVGHESGIEAASLVAALPILQDTDAVDAWSLWDVVYRDVRDHRRREPLRRDLQPLDPQPRRPRELR